VRTALYATARPMSRKVLFLSHEQRRIPFAMYRAPAMRNTLIARLRKVAITCGPPFLRIRDRSSSKVTSRTQWTPFSMDQ